MDKEEKHYSRKGFFGEFFSHFKRGIAHQVDRKLTKYLDGPLRPPGALDEVEFLSACTRCGACADACPYHAVQRMPMQAGVSANTPYIDPQTQACLVCEDTPCIAACGDGALLPLAEGKPAMGRAVVDEEACRTYDDKVCTLCYDACPWPEEALVIDEEFHPQVLDACTGCGQCQQRCPVHPVGIRVLSPLRLRAKQLDEELLFGIITEKDL